MHLMSTINERNEYHLQVSKSFYRWSLEVRTRKNLIHCVLPPLLTHIYIYIYVSQRQ